MKNIFKVIILIVFVIVITFLGCILFINKNIPNFKETSLYNYINFNYENIDKVVVKTVTLLGENCYKIDNDKGYDVLNSISIKKKSNMSCTDSDFYLEFYFKNGEHRQLYFECENFVYNDVRYLLKDDVVVYREDQLEFDEIKDNIIVISDDYKIKCE